MAPLITPMFPDADFDDAPGDGYDDEADDW